MKQTHQILDPRLGAQVPAGLCALAVMTKAPRAGKVKTRLSPPLKPEEAAALNRCFLRDTAAGITEVVRGGKARGLCVYTPVGEESAFAEILPENFALVPQRGDALGERLILAVEDILTLGFESLCLINSDSPTVASSAYEQAVHWLSEPGDRIVLGPADDGGYYLIGLRKTHRRVFEEIAWSTGRVLEQSVVRAKEIGVPVQLLPIGYDVDDPATLRWLCEELLGSEEATGAAIETRKFLASLIAREGRERIWPA